MDKSVPDPPINPETEAEDLRVETLLKDREAIKRALDYYLDPRPNTPKNLVAPARCT
jgi:hypothetical protein